MKVSDAGTVSCIPCPAGEKQYLNGLTNCTCLPGNYRNPEDPSDNNGCVDGVSNLLLDGVGCYDSENWCRFEYKDTNFEIGNTKFFI